MNRPPEAPLGQAAKVWPGKVVYSLEEVYDLTLAHQEDILLAEEQVNRSEQAVQLTRLETMPSFKVGLFYAGIGDPDVPNPPPDAGDDAVGVQFGMTLPLWLGKNQSRTARALAEKQNAQARKTEAANQVLARISRLWFKLENAERLIALYEKDLLPQAISSVRTAETWFKQGQGGFADFWKSRLPPIIFNYPWQGPGRITQKPWWCWSRWPAWSWMRSSPFLQENRPHEIHQCHSDHNNDMRCLAVLCRL